MSTDEIKRDLCAMGTAPLMLNGHRIDRLYVDTWVIGGEWHTLDAAAKRIAASRGNDRCSPLADLFLAMADNERRRRDAEEDA